MNINNVADTASMLETPVGTLTYHSLPKLADLLGKDINRLPYALRILMEGCLRNLGKSSFNTDALTALANWQGQTDTERQAVPFMPARILLQDFTGVPVLNDLAGLRAELARRGKPVMSVHPRIPCDLVIDHSVTVETYGCLEARRANEQVEFDLNFERYEFLKWSQGAFKNLRVLPPGLGICHQVNLEYLGRVAFLEDAGGQTLIYPDSVLGTDSHTTMINGLGILGWGVGGIEALAAMLGYAGEFPIPDVIGVELTGNLAEGVTPTDLTLTFTLRLRELGVVGKFAEVFGDGCGRMPVETRAMIANMSPESGATATYFPVDGQTLSYLRRSGREEKWIETVEAFYKAQGLFRDDHTKLPDYTQVVKIDLAAIKPLIAGPKRPQDAISLSEGKKEFFNILTSPKGLQGYGLDAETAKKVFPLKLGEQQMRIPQGAVLIAAITSCTNTSDPFVMVAAGLLARNAAAKGLAPKPWVKTSFAPGSRAVETYLKNAGLLSGLEQTGFSIVGYGCTTCIGNSGPIDAALSRLVREQGLVGAAVLSGNRNFEGRIHPDARANFLASPPLVVAYALAGFVGVDFNSDALGQDEQGNAVFLRDIYPSNKEIEEVVSRVVKPEIYQENYQSLYQGNARWNEMPAPQGEVFPWSKDSTMILEPGFLFKSDSSGQSSIIRSHALALLGDSVTTDHISPAGRIAPEILAGEYLQQLGVQPSDFISFGARRGNHEVMARGAFSNPRLRNHLVPDVEGGFTRHLPSGELMTIYDAAQRYMKDGIPLVILAGKAYGSGSSRDWAAKGTYLLGVRAVFAESYERIHRTNLVCMGILPLQFKKGETITSLNLTGDEYFTIDGIDQINGLKPDLQVTAERSDGTKVVFKVTALIDTPLELEYFKFGGLMNKVLQGF